MRNKFIMFFCLLGLLFPLLSGAQPKYEIRAVWVTTLGGLDFPSQKAVSPAGAERQKQELCRLLDGLQRARFNTVLFQVRLRGDVVYPSAIEPFAESLAGEEGHGPGYDLLRFAVDECHRRGMELHAWMVTIPVGSERQVRLQGKNSLVRKHPLLCKLYKGTWYLDPGNPATDDYLAGIVREVVSRYDVDGIHFDYIRYPERMEAFPDRDTFRRHGKGKALKQWRRDNITRIVRRLYAETKSLKPWVKVSSSPVGKYADTRRYPSTGWNAYDEVCQDARRWLEEGIQDLIFPMMYFRGNHFYPFALDWLENKCGRWVVPGLGIYFLQPGAQEWDLDEVVRQVYFLRNAGADGQAYFRSRFLLGNVKGVKDELEERFYAEPAVVPPMVWADSIPPSAPSHPSFLPLERGVALAWTASADNLPAPVYYRVYASDTYPVDTERASNLMRARVDSTRCTVLPELPWLEKTYWAVTAVDRCGNESEPLEMNAPFAPKQIGKNDGNK